MAAEVPEKRRGDKVKKYPNRFNLYLPEKAQNFIAEIKTMTGEISISEIIRRALSTYHLVLSHVKKGQTMCFIDDETGNITRVINPMIDR